MPRNHTCFRIGAFILSWISWTTFGLAVTPDAMAVRQRQGILPELMENNRPLTTSGTLLIAIFNTDVPSPPPLNPPGKILTEMKNQLQSQLIFMLYDGGTIVWSKDLVKGGKPYYKSTIKQSKVREVLTSIRAKGWFSNPLMNTPHYGPDSAYTTIYARSGNDVLYMQSWHELAEQNLNLVVTASGISTLAGRDRDEVLKNDKPEYHAFRSAWAEIKRMLVKLIPTSNTPPAPNLQVNPNARLRTNYLVPASVTHK